MKINYFSTTAPEFALKSSALPLESLPVCIILKHMNIDDENS